MLQTSDSALDHSITFGLRDSTNGHLVHVYSRDELDNINYPPHLETGEYANGPRFEVKKLSDLIWTIKEDTPYYNASLERPGWGDVDVGRCIPVAYYRENTYDAGGGDPIRTVERVRKLVLPTLFAGKVRSTREKAPDFIMKRTFGEVTRDLWGKPDTRMLLADVSDGDRIAPGMIVQGPMAHLLSVVAVVDVPEDWPDAPAGDNFRLVLGSTSAIENEIILVDFEPSDFEPAAAAPTL